MAAFSKHSVGLSFQCAVALTPLTNAQSAWKTLPSMLWPTSVSLFWPSSFWRTREVKADWHRTNFYRFVISMPTSRCLWYQKRGRIREIKCQIPHISSLPRFRLALRLQNGAYMRDTTVFLTTPVSEYPCTPRIPRPSWTIHAGDPPITNDTIPRW